MTERKTLIAQELSEIKKLYQTNQFVILDKKILSLAGKLNPGIEDEYSAFIELKIIFIELLVKSGKIQQAFAEINSLLSQFPFEINVLKKKYLLLKKLRQQNESINILQDLVCYFPDDFGLNTDLISYYLEINKKAEALLLINKLLVINNQNPELLMLAISILKEEGLYQELSEKIRQLQKLKPDDISLIRTETDILFKLGKYGEILPVLHNFLTYLLEEGQITNEFILLLYKYGELYKRAGKHDLLVEIIIKILTGAFTNFSVQGRQMFENITKKLKLDLIFYFFCHPAIRAGKKADLRFLVTNNKLTGSDIIENLVLMAQNEEYLNNPGLSINDFLELSDLIKLIPPDYQQVIRLFCAREKAGFT